MPTENAAMDQGSGAHEAPGPPSILVLGIGNVLLADEGVGVHVVESLRRSFDFSDNVLLMDGGTLGLGLLDPIMEADALVVIDAVHAGSQPATIHRLTDADLHRALSGSNSLHELGLAETLTAARLLGKRLEVVILGIEPEDINTWSTRLTKTVERRVPDLVAAALREVVRMGGSHTPKQTGTPKGSGRDSLCA